MCEFGFFHRKTVAFRQTAFLCLALQLFSTAGAIASPLLNYPDHAASHENQDNAPALVQEYVLILPSEHETNASVATRFGVA